MRTIYVQDGDTYQVNDALTTDEIKRQLASLLGQPWLTTASVCNRADGGLEFKRPAAAPKG